MSLSVRIIPCLDVTDGRVVKGVNFTDLVDAGDPVEMASLYNLEGADELTFLDISASVAGRDRIHHDSRSGGVRPVQCGGRNPLRRTAHHHR